MICIYSSLVSSQGKDVEISIDKKADKFLFDEDIKELRYELRKLAQLYKVYYANFK